MIKDLKDFEKMLKICRKQGVSEVSISDMTIKFGELPIEASRLGDQEIVTDELSPEQLAFYAVEGQR